VVGVFGGGGGGRRGRRAESRGIIQDKVERGMERTDASDSQGDTIDAVLFVGRVGKSMRL
jgi:hypothetical protein